MTTTFKCIPALRILTLAIKAGHTPKTDAKDIVKNTQHDYIRFALAICEALSHVNYDSMQLGMDQIQAIAKEHAGFEEYDMFDPKHGGHVDTIKLIQSSQQAVFFERFAHLIGAELKPTATTINTIVGDVAPGAHITQTYVG